MDWIKEHLKVILLVMGSLGICAFLVFVADVDQDQIAEGITKTRSKHKTSSRKRNRKTVQVAKVEPEAQEEPEDLNPADLEVDEIEDPSTKMKEQAKAEEDEAPVPEETPVEVAEEVPEEVAEEVPEEVPEVAVNEVSENSYQEEESYQSDEPAPEPVTPEGFDFLSPSVINKYYDETSPYITLSWSPKGHYSMILSRSPSLHPVHKRRQLTNRSSYRWKNLIPGTWYGQIQDDDGNPIKNFTINIKKPQSLALSILKPNALTTFKIKNGKKMVEWGADKGAAYYSLQISKEGSFKNLAYRYTTSKPRVVLKDLVPGKYYLRLAGFNKRSGRMEYSLPQQIHVKE